MAGVEQPAQLVRAGRLWSVRQAARVDRPLPRRESRRVAGAGAPEDATTERWRVHVADGPGGPVAVLDLARLADGTWQLAGEDA